MTSHVVFGGCGFLGRHVVRSLLGRGDDVLVVDIAEAWSGEAGRAPRFHLADLAAATPGDFDRMVGEADIVHHYAWSTIPQTANADPLADMRANVGATIGVLDALRRRGGGRIVFTSSGGTVYGRLRATPVPETHALAPISAYGVSKVSAENYLGFYRDLHGIDARVARIANPYGAGQNPLRPQGVATTVVHRALAGEAIEVWGNGEVVRDFVHISDVAAGLIALCDAADLAAGPLPVFNVGSGRGSSVNEIIGAVEARLGRPLRIDRKPGRAFDVPISVLDIAEADARLGWRPRLDIVGGIDRMVTDLEADPHRLFSS